VGNTYADYKLTIGEGNCAGQFIPHLITSGIVNMYEGVTISYPQVLGPLKVLAMSTDDHPAILYADHESLDSNCGPVIVDCGFTKLYGSWEEAGTSRYVINACIWLLDLEHNIVMGNDVTCRRKRRGIDDHTYKLTCVNGMKNAAKNMEIYNREPFTCATRDPSYYPVRKVGWGYEAKGAVPLPTYADTVNSSTPVNNFYPAPTPKAKSSRFHFF